MENYASIGPQPASATILNGNTTSAEIDLQGGTITGMFFPAAITSATLKISAATISGGTFETVQKDEFGGGDYTITVTASKYVPITNLAVVKGLRFIKLVGASSEGADRIINLAIAPI